MSSSLPPEATFELVLDKVYRPGGCPLDNPSCMFSYKYDFQKNMGSALLISVNGSDVNIVLNPMGLSNYYGFISDMSPTSFVINGQKVVIYRVILHLYNDGTRSAAIMFNQDGSCIEVTSNLSDEASSSLAT